MADLDSGSSGKHPLLHVLIAEDNPLDAELVVAILKRAGFALSFEIVDEPAAFEHALTQSRVDLVLCDHNLRSWTGFDALAMVKKSGRDIPFIIITAVLGDEAAVDYIKQGAAEYVLKHRLERLALAVRQAVGERAHRAGQKVVLARNPPAGDAGGNEPLIPALK